MTIFTLDVHNSLNILLNVCDSLLINQVFGMPELPDMTVKYTPFTFIIYNHIILSMPNIHLLSRL